MKFRIAIAATLLLFIGMSAASATTWTTHGPLSYDLCASGKSFGDGNGQAVTYTNTTSTNYYYSYHATYNFVTNEEGCIYCYRCTAHGCSSSALLGSVTNSGGGDIGIPSQSTDCNSARPGGGCSISDSGTVSSSSIKVHVTPASGWIQWVGTLWAPGTGSATIIISDEPPFTLSGTMDCIDYVELYLNSSGNYYLIGNDTSPSSYSFDIYNNTDYRIVFDGMYYDFACDGDVTFDYDACIWVYGYTCGIDAIKLYKDDGGWVLDDTESQPTGYSEYEIPIVSGDDYLISFIDSGTVCHNTTFSCSGDHVLIDFDRCNWVWPPSPWATPYRIYLWTGYDYNVVVFKDEHGNFIENSQLAIYDKTDDQYIQRWTDASDGYTLLGARFDTDHDVILSLRTFDGVFTLDTTYPANGSAAVGEEDITTTNWTVPIKYNLNVLPVDQYGAALFDVFCGLSEYTPLDPGSFWGMDLSDQGYVPVTNCSGFAMCDIIAEKEGYADYSVEALNWTSKSALVKDYRHNVVMEEE